MKKLKFLLISLLCVAVVCGGAVGIYASDYHSGGAAVCYTRRA